MLAWAIFFQVTGDGHRGIGLSGVSRSAFGSRLQVPAAVMGKDGSSNRSLGGLGVPALPQDTTSRLPGLRLP